MLDFLTFALCVPYSETTDGRNFDMLLDMVSERGRSIFRLFQVIINVFLKFIFCPIIMAFIPNMSIFSILQWLL